MRTGNNGGAHAGLAVWFTGLSGAGKSTLAGAVAERLKRRGIRQYILDGDIVRSGLNKDLGFSEADRRENVRRIGEVAKLFVDSGQVVLAAFISPFRDDRDKIRRSMGAGEFVEVHVKCSLELCELRDPKGLYKRARNGEIPSFTGIDSPYEEPLNPELAVDTGRLSLEESADRVMRTLERFL